MYLKFIENKFNKKVQIRLVNYSGRNFFGRICVFHKSAGHKALYKQIDIQRKLNCVGIIIKIIRNTFATANQAYIFYENGLISCCIISENVFLGDSIYSGYIFNSTQNFIVQGSAIPMKYINIFTYLNSIEYFFGSGFKFARAAGQNATLISKQNNEVTIKLNSGWIKKINMNAMGCIGRNSNMLHKYDNLMKAGVNRFFGKRPTVRGIVKNPCDHPHGGGEGKNSPPAAQVSPWGKLTKGTPTKNKKKHKKLRNLYKQTI